MATILPTRRWKFGIFTVAIVPFILYIYKESIVQVIDEASSTINKITLAKDFRPRYQPSVHKENRIDEKRFDEIFHVRKFGDPFSKVSFAIHRNGDIEPCGTTLASNSTMIEFMNITESRFKRKNLEKYDVDAILTQTLASSLLDPKMCPSSSSSWLGKSYPAFFGYCDMGEDKTPIQPDHNKMISVINPITQSSSLPCHFHTREGVRITSLKQLAQLASNLSSLKNTGDCNFGDLSSSETCSVSTELHLYAVPAGRVFMFAPSYVGEVFELPHVNGNVGKPISLEVLSLNPRVFDVKNFFSKDEAEGVVTKALNEKSESHRIKRSSTGASGYNVNSKRTSENGFDTHGKIAMAVKNRCFEVLGFEEYVESMADGLQVLRYNKTTAYIPHLDWIDDYQREQEHNFDSGGVGSNRFATILLYMTDIAEDAGGETVFTKAWPSDVQESNRVPLKQAITSLRESGLASDLEENSWEEKMAAECKIHFAVKPNSARAVLFYSQHPDGQPDLDSIHGGCPVLSGDKWAANLWVWNAPRGGYSGAPVNQDVVDRNKRNGKKVESDIPQLQAKFLNSKGNPKFKNAKLYFQETLWGDFGFGQSHAVNTFTGHEWNVVVDGETLQQWIIGTEKYKEYFV